MEYPVKWQWAAATVHVNPLPLCPSTDTSDVDSGVAARAIPARQLPWAVGTATATQRRAAQTVGYITARTSVTLGCGGWGTVIVTASAQMSVTPAARGPGGVLRAVPALCARCAQSLYRTMSDLHSGA